MNIKTAAVFIMCAFSLIFARKAASETLEPPAELTLPAPKGETLSPPGGGTLPPPNARTASGTRTTQSFNLPLITRPLSEPPVAKVAEVKNPAPSVQTVQTAAIPIDEESRSAPKPAAKKAAPDEGFYIGGMAGLYSPSYNAEEKSISGSVTGLPSLNGGILAGFGFWKLAVEAEALFAGEKAESINLAFSSSSMLFPVLVKGNVSIGGVVLQPFAGVYFNLAVSNLKVESLTTSGEDNLVNPFVGLMTGLAVGIKLGSGVIFLDGRFAFDFGKTKAGQDVEIWEKSAFMMSAGYQLKLSKRK